MTTFKLPPQERMEVVERILDGQDEPDVALDALWAKEADDRCGPRKRMIGWQRIGRNRLN